MQKSISKVTREQIKDLSGSEKTNLLLIVFRDSTRAIGLPKLLYDEDCVGFHPLLHPSSPPSLLLHLPSLLPILFLSRFVISID